MAIIVLGAHSAKKICQEKIKTFRSYFIERAYSENIILGKLSEMEFEERNLAFQPNKWIFPFVAQYQPSVPNLKQIVMKKCHFKQPLLSGVFKGVPLILYKRGGFWSKIYPWEPSCKKRLRHTLGVMLACQTHHIGFTIVFDYDQFYWYKTTRPWINQIPNCKSRISNGWLISMNSVNS